MGKQGARWRHFPQGGIATIGFSVAGIVRPCFFYCGKVELDNESARANFALHIRSICCLVRTFSMHVAAIWNFDWARIGVRTLRSRLGPKLANNSKFLL